MGLSYENKLFTKATIEKATIDAKRYTINQALILGIPRQVVADTLLDSSDLNLIDSRHTTTLDILRTLQIYFHFLAIHCFFTSQNSNLYKENECWKLKKHP